MVTNANAASRPQAPEELRLKLINASQKHLIQGVYHLINQKDLKAAESEFRQAIILDQHNGEAYYFLGRIYSEQTTSSQITGDVSASQLQQYIGTAKALLSRAQELGVTDDKLHPERLKQLQQEYPKVAPIYEAQFFPQKVKIIIETPEPTFKMRVLKMNERDATVKQVGTFRPEEEIQLEGGASYQMEFSPPKPQNTKHLLLISIGLAIWLIR